VEAGYSVLFLTLESLMTRLVRAQQENRLERGLKQLVYPKVLRPAPTAGAVASMKWAACPCRAMTLACSSGWSRAAMNMAA
jgi:hypothetical protein